MRRTAPLAVVFALALWALPTDASAISVTCPNPVIGGGPPPADNQYTVDPALDCVYGGFPGPGGADSALNGSSNDAFLNGTGTNEDDYVPGAPFAEDPTFGLTWTFICSSGNTTGTCSGLTYTVNGSLTSGTWSVTDTNFLFYALGIKDGSAPQWAVFLLDSSALSGVMSMVGGQFSHFVLYGSGTPTTTDITVPEPTSLLLLGLGLIVAGQRLRRQRRAS